MRMKRSFVALLLLFIIFCPGFLAASGQNELAITAMLVSGEYEEASKRLPSSLTPQVLEQSLGSVVAIVGQPEGLVSARPGQVVWAFENADLAFSYQFEEDKVVGLNINFVAAEAVTTGSFEEQSVKVGQYELDGSLCLPQVSEIPPVVILIQGSGSSDKNETVMSNSPFQDLAYGLAEEGVATLRYDKRFYARPDLAADGIDLESEYLEDVNSAIEMAFGMGFSKVFVLGHSLGGSLVPVIAKTNEGLSGIISMAGSLRPLWRLSYDQNQEIIGKMSPEQKASIQATIDQLEKDLVTIESDELDTVDSQGTLMGLPVEYLRSIKRNCGLDFIDEVDIPVLVLQGSADFQVYPDVDYTLWQEALAGRDNCEFHLYEGLNHIFMQTNGKRDVSEYAVSGHVDQAVIDDIASFVLAN